MFAFKPPQLCVKKSHTIFLLTLFGAQHSAFSQQPPSAGSQLQQIPSAPAATRSAPALRLPSAAQPASDVADHTTVIINALHVTGMSLIPPAQLYHIIGFTPGSALTLSDLSGMAAKLAEYYQQRGYFLAQAYLPPQEIEDGQASITVLEGRYGAVTLHNDSHLSSRLASDLLAAVQSGAPVTGAALENSLLTLSDLPGVRVKSTMSPGATLGSADLLVEVTPGPRVSGSVDADNEGNRYTGQNRIGALVYLNDPFGQGDLASARVLTSLSGLNYGRLAYQSQFGRVKAGLAYTSMTYRLGQDFASLAAHGTARISSLYGSYPLLRSRTDNLYLQLNLDAKTFQDESDSTASSSAKKAKVWSSSLTGDHLDRFGALNNFALTWSRGVLAIASPEARATDAATLRSNGRYDKLALTASRLDQFTPALALYGAVSGQLTSNNLDVSEKMGLGGGAAVRAYPEGEAYADQGYVLNLEARLTLPATPLPGQMQAITFLDSGSASLNKAAWSTGPNRRTLSGAGLGLNWTGENHFLLKAYYAHKLGDAAATSAPDAASRFWIQAVQYF